MSPQMNDYNDIRQIVQDAISPLTDQLNRIYDSLNREFYRKDALDPRLEAMQKELDEVKAQVMGGPQKILLMAASVVGFILSIISLAQYIRLH